MARWQVKDQGKEKARNHLTVSYQCLCWSKAIGVGGHHIDIEGPSAVMYLSQAPGI